VYVNGASPASLSATLLECGYARYVDWSAKQLPINESVLASAAALRKREMEAQSRAIGLWKAAPPVARDTTRTGAAVIGRVVEVVSGDTVVVAAEGGRSLRVSLARYAHVACAFRLAWLCFSGLHRAALSIRTALVPATLAEIIIHARGATKLPRVAHTLSIVVVASICRHHAHS
jgi:endonuclease YncB( thermonuclease family)